MNFIKTFEARVADAFGASPQGYTAPFSFKKLAKRAAKEMEGETFIVDGVDTAPALYTVLVASADDEVMRPLYPQLTAEIVAFVEAQAAQKGYLFVGRPLARFMVDPSLKSGKFFVFAENVDYDTLERLRGEEEAFLAGTAGEGGAAPAASAGMRQAASAVRFRPRRGAGAVQVMTAVEPAADLAPAAAGGLASAGDESLVAGDGLDVLPADLLGPGEPAVAVPPTQLRAPAHEAPHPGAGGARPHASAEAAAPPVATCLLIERKTGRTYNASAPATTVGREQVVGNVVLRDPNVSRRHAELTHDGHAWRICDLGSTNGTLVNDLDVTQCVLHDGDVITLGLTNLEFRENA